jgi:hypothetical protein
MATGSFARSASGCRRLALPAAGGSYVLVISTDFARTGIDKSNQGWRCHTRWRTDSHAIAKKWRESRIAGGSQWWFDCAAYSLRQGLS